MNMEEKDYCVLSYRGERIPIRITVLRAEEGHGDMNIRSCDGREWSVRGGVVLLNGTPVDPDEVDIQRPGPQDDAILSSLVDMEEMGFCSLDYPIPDGLPGTETTEAEASVASETPTPESAGTETAESASSPQKYELIPADAIYPGMFRVRALRDIPRYKVHAGDEGGVITGEGNLSQEGDCWVERGAMVWNGAFVTGNALLGGEAEAIDCARIEGEAQISGNSSIQGDAVISGESRIWGNMVIAGRTRVSGKSVLYGREVLSEDREYHDYQVNYVDSHPGTPLFSKLQKRRGEKCLFCVADTEEGRKVGIGVSLDVQMQRIMVRTHCFGRKATWKDILAVFHEDLTLWRQLMVAAKEAHKARTNMWRTESVAGEFWKRDFLVREKDEVTCMFKTPGRVTGKIRRTARGYINDFSLSFADWYVLYRFVTADVWMVGCTLDHYKVEEVPTAEPGLEWNAPGAEPWESK